MFICKWVKLTQPEHLLWPPPWNLRTHVPPSRTPRQSSEIPSVALPESNAKDGLSPSWVNMTAVCFDMGIPSHKVVHGRSQAHLQEFLKLTKVLEFVCSIFFDYSARTCFISSMPKRNVWLWCSTSLRIKCLYIGHSLFASTVFTYHEHQPFPLPHVSEPLNSPPLDLHLAFHLATQLSQVGEHRELLL